MKTLLSFALLFLLNFCENNNSEKVYPKRDSLVGKWQLYETCISPGDKWKPELVKEKLIIEFKADGRLLIIENENKNGSFPCNGNWKILEPAAGQDFRQIQFTFECHKAIWTNFYSFNDNNSVNINPMCVEECRYTYRPVD